MKRLLLTASMLSLLTFGCGHSLMQPTQPDAEQATAAGDEASTADETAGPAPASAPATSAARQRQPGEFATYRFSGTYRSSPVTVTYRVLDRDQATIRLAVALESEGTTQRFRLEMSDAPDAPAEIRSVARRIDGTDRPMDLAEYQALMSQTIAPIESNEQSLERTDHQVDVAGRTLPCTMASYRVLADGEPATMTVLESAGFAWGDLGGEITRADGTLLYKAEIVELGGPQPTTEAVAATVEDFDLYELDL